MRPCSDATPWPLFAVFDIESESWVQVTCLCHVDEFGNRKHFRSVAEYMDWLFSPAFESDLVWAHWGGRYDHRFIIWEATQRAWAYWCWEAMVSGNLIVILVVRDGDGNQVKFCESGRLMPDSVAKIGKTVGLEKLDVDRRKIGSYTEETIIEYCYRDCDIVLEGLKGMRSTLSAVGCDFGFTLASIATRHVRRSEALEWWRFYDKVMDPETGRTKLEYSKAMLRADEFCEPSYFGGRTEVFRKGVHRDLFLYDICSSYPWSMTQELPAYFRGFYVPPTKLVSYAGRAGVRVQDTAKALRKCGVSDVSVKMPVDTVRYKYPVLPWRDRDAHKVVFPLLTDFERGTWTNVELRELWEQGREHGLELQIHVQAVYEPLAFLRPFVTQFFEMRMQAMKDGDEFRKYAFKILLNSLYGKLIETTVRRSVLFGDDFVQAAIDKHGLEAVVMSPAPGAYFLTTESQGPFRHVAAGSYVTALSRLRLLDGIKQAQAAGAQIYYCDTDSLIVDKPVFGRTSEKRLGDFSLEMEIAEAEILSSKVYKLTARDGKVIYKAKGMPIRQDAATEGEFSGDAAELRWRMFTAALHGENLEKPTREGIGGFLADLKRGHINPEAYELPRQMKFGDMKRAHLENGDSEPLVWIPKAG
jgi:DNA polymerase type B, organellar and viral